MFFKNARICIVKIALSIEKKMTCCPMTTLGGPGKNYDRNKQTHKQSDKYCKLYIYISGLFECLLFVF